VFCSPLPSIGLVGGGPRVGPGGIFSLGEPVALELLAKVAGFVDVAVEAIPLLIPGQALLVSGRR